MGLLAVSSRSHMAPHWHPILGGGGAKPGCLLPTLGIAACWLSRKLPFLLQGGVGISECEIIALSGGD